MVDATTAETLGWLTAVFISIFLIPMIWLFYLRLVNPELENKISISFYLGWIPGNLISLGYLCWNNGNVIDFIFLLFFCQVIQAIAILVMRGVFIRMFGEDAFH